jgi:uncharacterized protein involved in outer membrane biogenesis
MTQGEPSAPGSHKGSGARPIVAVAVVIAAALAALVAYLYLGAPGLVRSEILKAIAERYHRTARLDRVTLDPLRLQAEADGFSLPDRDGRPMIAFRRLNARLSWPSLLTGQVAFEELTLDAPQVRAVRRADGRLNLMDLAPPDDPNSKLPRVRIARFRLVDGRAQVVDQMRPTPFEKQFDHIAFSLRDFVTTKDGASYALSAQTDAGERLSWRGTLGVAPLASQGRFLFEGWRVDRLAAAIPGGLPFKVTSGVLDAQGSYDIALKGQALAAHLTLDRATLTAAAIRPNGATSDPIRAQAITVSGVSLDLGQHAIKVDHLVATAPDVSAWLSKDGALSLAAFMPPPAPGGVTAPGPAWTVSAPDIRIERGRASFEDRSAPDTAAWTLDPVNLAVSGLAYPFQAPVRISAHVEADDGSSLSATGTLTPPARAGALPTGQFDFALDGLELNRFQSYVSDLAKVSIASGDASAKGRLDLASSGGVSFAGALSVDNLQAVDLTSKSELVTWDRVTASGIVADSQPFSVKVARIQAQGAYGRVVLEPGYTLNIRAVLEQPGAPPPGAVALDIRPVKASTPAPPKAGPPVNLPIDIDRIDFTDGRMDFTDLTVQPHFSAGIQGLSGHITGLSARAGARAQVDLKGGVDPFAPVTITGALEPFAADRFLDMTMRFHNVEMTTFSPYSGKFAGYRIDKGKLDLDLHYHIADEKLEASHHVVINQLQLGEKVDSSDASKLPIRLIVALLKDRNGVIDLPIDISGSVDDPKFKIWPVIWKVVDNLLGKIAAAPFTLLGDLVGHGGGESLGRITFQPGSALLAPQEVGKLASLAKALDQRPALNLEIPETVAPSLDGPALADLAYQDSLTRAMPAAFRRGPAMELATVLATPKLKRKLLETAYLQTFGQGPSAVEAAAPATAGKDRDKAAADAVEAALRAEFAARGQALAALAQARAQTVEAALVQDDHIDPKRIFVVTRAPLTAGPIVMTVALK